MPKPITDTLRLLQGGVFIDNCSELIDQIRLAIGTPVLMGTCT